MPLSQIRASFIFIAIATSAAISTARSIAVRQHRNICLALLIVVVQGCSLISTKDESTRLPQDIDLVRDLEQIEALQDWSLMGKIGFRTKNDGGSAAINNWDQKGEFYRVELSSTFLGLGNVVISGGQGFVSIIGDGEEPQFSENPDEMLYQALGFPLPARYLSIWIKGIPDLSAPYQSKLDDQGFLAEINQHGWKIQFSKYQALKDIILPGKVVMYRDEVKVTLAIKSWNLQ